MGSLKKFKSIDGGVAAALGFSAGGIKAGIKVSGNPDLALVVSDRLCSAAGCFTTNNVRASSVDWCESVLPSKTIRAAICNAGNANACTGKQGEKDTASVAAMTGKLLDAPAKSILVAATGVIGHPLPVGKIQQALPRLVSSLSPNFGDRFTEAIMTTDTKPKNIAFEVKTPNGRYIIGGCVKGSGMIHPNMATMLGFITTDAGIDHKVLDRIVKRVVDKTFNNLTVDGDTSTNDMVLVMANGASDVAIKKPQACVLFEQALFAVCDTLCSKIAEDGEGATKRVEIRTKGGKTYQDAKKAAKSIANSNLVKCALFGNDPNWGRILCAIGYSGASFSPTKMRVKLCGKLVCKGTTPVAFDAKAMSAAMAAKVVNIDVDLGEGTHEAIAHTCDLTYDYVKINAEYHT